MRWLSQLLGFLALTGSAYAGCVDNGGFLEVSPYRKQIEFLKDHIRAADSTIRFNCGTLGEACSGAFISDSCHLLTALHCLKTCLVSSGAVEQHEHYATIDRSKLKPLSIGSGAKTYSAQLVASGPGWFDRQIVHPFSDEQKQIKSSAKTLLPELEKIAATQHLGENQSDWAILELSGAQCTCSPVAQSEPGVGEPVFLVSFPGVAERKDGHDSNGLDQYYSDGKVLSADQWAQRWKSDGPFWLGYDRIVGEFSPDALTSSADSYSGSSGSSAFNSNGEIVGVTSNSTADEFRYDPNKYTTVSVRISTIRKAVSPQVFECSAAKP